MAGPERPLLGVTEVPVSAANDGVPEAQAKQREQVSLEQIILDAGHTPGDQIERFVSYASELQSRRREIGATESDGITRSVALYAVMELDPDIAGPLRDCGINMNEFAKVLSLMGPRA
jgi:hypothetical protein